MVQSVYPVFFVIFRKCLVGFPKITRFGVEGKVEKISKNFFSKVENIFAYLGYILGRGPP